MSARTLFRACLYPFFLFCLMVVLTGSSNSQEDKLDLIRAAIKEKGAQWTPKETPLTRLSIEQLKRMMGDKSRDFTGQEPIVPRPTDSIPDSIDWRNIEGHNYVTSIKDQTSECGSCVAFDAVATLESLICIEEERPDEDFDLSEMDLFMCGGGSCSTGWDNGSACIRMLNFGVPDEYCWPYVPEDTLCVQSCSNKTLRDVQIGSAHFIMGQTFYMQAVSIAPIMTTMAVYEDFVSHGSGIYEHVWGDFLGWHSICIIGYNTEGQTPYWIVKNSWGEDWGADGFGRIKMGECGIEGGGFWISGATLPPAPPVPSDLISSSVSGHVRLDWEDNSDNEMIFELERKEGAGAFITIAEIPANSSSYVDTEVDSETTYSYQIRALNITAASEYSNIATLTTPSPAPTNLHVISVTGSSATLEWEDNSPDEDGFRIEKKKGSGTWSTAATVGPNMSSVEVDLLEEYATYSFRVCSCDEHGDSAWSNTVTVTTMLRAPSDLIATATASDTICLSWDDNSGKEGGFKIEQKENGGSWQLICTVVSNTTVKEINGLSPGTDYCYRICAYKDSSTSIWSNTSCSTTQSGVPAAPSNLTATGYCWEVELTWQDNSSDESGFNIYRLSGSTYFFVGSVGPNTTTYWDRDLPCGLLWCYKIRAFNQNGNSPACPNRCAKTSPCYQCQEWLGLKVVPEQSTVEVGDTITYTFTLSNKVSVDLANISVVDSVFGQIVSGISLRAGEERTFTRPVVITSDTTRSIEARGSYVAATKEIVYVTAKASATVRIR